MPPRMHASSLPAVGLTLSARSSVIIPTFNRAAMLAGTLRSVLDQTERDLEVIVVDDGSTDDTAGIVARVAATDDRVQYHHQARGGASTARNAGLERASGEFVAFLDSDDSWQPWHLALMIAALERFPTAVLAWSDTDLVDHTGRVVERRGIRQLLGAWSYFSLEDLFSSAVDISELGLDGIGAAPAGRVHFGDIYSPMVMGNLVLTSSAVLRRDRIAEIGRFEAGLRVGEDYDYFIRACRMGPVVYADVPDICYRVGTLDKLAAPAASLAMATGYLSVLERTLARDRDRITLPPRMIAIARAHAHGWIGERHLLTGMRSSARHELARSLRIRPAQARVAALLAVSMLPDSIIQRAAGARRAIRRF